MILKIALKNLFSAGIRTWLTVFVLSLTLGSMIFLQALMAGMQDEMMTARIYEEISGGEIWHKNYDPFDPLTLDESRSIVPNAIQNSIDKGDSCPLLIVNGAAYYKNRFKSTMLNGIDPNQKCLRLDFTPLLDEKEGLLSVMIGKRWAKAINIVKGDQLTLRWRTEEGAFNALDAVVVGILDSQVPNMDVGKIWLSQKTLNNMNQTKNYATKIWVRPDAEPPQVEGWVFQSTNTLLSDTIELVETKSAGQSFFFMLLLFLGLVAIFDTQALSIFRRKKEIGTFMAMGMSNNKVLTLFVTEGVLYGIVATFVTAVWGIPLFYWTTQVGIEFGVSGDQYGIVMGSSLFPVFKVGKVISAVLIVNFLVLLVSFWPVRKITRLLPANALRGRLS